jgi:rare lipoprotein A
MRHLFASLALTFVLSVGASLPAAADYGLGGGGVSANWSEGIRFRNSEPAERPQRQRYASATYGDVYYGDDDTERPRQRAHKRAHGKQHAKHRSARTAKESRRHQRAVEKPAAKPEPKVALHQPPPANPPAAAPTAPAPGWTKKSLGSDGKKQKDLGAENNKAAKEAAAKAPGARGVASFYWQPQRVASGGWFNPNAMTAAHKTLPFGTRVRVTHLGNGRSVEVKINDRGPYIAGRIIDLSKAAAGVIGMTGQGLARVVVEVLGR